MHVVVIVTEIGALSIMVIGNGVRWIWWKQKYWINELCTLNWLLCLSNMHLVEIGCAHSMLAQIHIRIHRIHRIHVIHSIHRIHCIHAIHACIVNVM